MLVYEDNGGRDNIGMERALEIIEKKKPQTNHTSCIRKEYDGIIDKAIKRNAKSHLSFHIPFCYFPERKTRLLSQFQCLQVFSESWSYVFSSKSKFYHGFEVA